MFQIRNSLTRSYVRIIECTSKKKSLRPRQVERLTVSSSRRLERSYSLAFWKTEEESDIAKLFNHDSHSIRRLFRWECRAFKIGR